MTKGHQLAPTTYGAISPVVSNVENLHTIDGNTRRTPEIVESSSSPISLIRALPSNNETVNTLKFPTLVDQMDPLDSATGNSSTLPSASNQEEEYCYNPFDEFIIEGYENVTEEQTTLEPPQMQITSETNQPTSRRGNADIPVMDDVTARDAVLSFVSQNLCWGLSAAKDMSILDIIPSSAFHYKLETCTEKRVASWVHEPYTGQVIDSADRGPSPKPWDILVVAPNPFRDGQFVVEVPHSARIVKCNDCGTLGRIRCWSCFGNGEIRCSACNGTGRPGVSETVSPTETSRVNEIAPNRACPQCNGAGQRRCVVCLGPGQLPCKKCLARGQLKLSLQLTVIWRVYKSDRIVERTSMPEHLIRSVTGRVAFEEEKASVWPINFFPDEAVNHSSRELLDEHRARFSSEKMMIQKQSVHLVPVYQVAYAWRSHRGFFHIYGYDNRVYFPDYPQKSCCGLLDAFSCCGSLDSSTCSLQ